MSDNIITVYEVPDLVEKKVLKMTKYLQTEKDDF